MVYREEMMNVSILLHQVIPMHFNQSTSIVSNANDQLFSSCGNTIWPWLFLHLCYTWLISLYVILPLAVTLMLLNDRFWRWYGGDHYYDDDFSAYELNHSTSHTLRRYVRREVQLILVYLCLAFVFTWLTSHRKVNWITLARWLIEAAWTPHIILTLVSTYADMIYNRLITFDMPDIATTIYLIKGTVFVWMRYAEWNPSAELNDFQTFFFYQFCNELGLHRRPYDHRLRRFMLDPDTSTSS